MSERIYLCLAHMSGNEEKYIKEAFLPSGPMVSEDQARWIVEQIREAIV
ncbi:MAG: hypothetical protein LIP09_15055 [Bacteroidales bacterium]|nr:hypothetical protein [Bacteroidales bacterium]